MSRPRLFRRRFIPDENIELKDDMILALEPNLIITSWNVLKPRRDISRGVSAYFIDKGIKVSKVFDNAGQMVYWYCDIIETHYDEKENTYTFNDLLIDVVVYPDGQVEVLDMDEFADAMEQGILRRWHDRTCNALQPMICYIRSTPENLKNIHTILMIC